MSNINNQTSICKEVFVCNDEALECGTQAIERNIFTLYYECPMCGSEWSTQEQNRRNDKLDQVAH